MPEYVGKCSCGRVDVRFQSSVVPEQFQPRSDAATCSFCREHDGVWISDPKGALDLRTDDGTSVSRFGSRQVDFHLCTGCGELAYALVPDPSRAAAVGVVRLGLFESIRVAAQPTLTTSGEGETLDAARERRLARWTPVHRR
jgi:hypothetical protein